MNFQKSFSMSPLISCAYNVSASPLPRKKKKKKSSSPLVEGKVHSQNFGILYMHSMFFTGYWYYSLSLQQCCWHTEALFTLC